MSAPQARQLDGKFYCPEKGCTRGYGKPNSLRKHCKDVHRTRVSCKRKVVDAEQRKQQNREASKRYREKKMCEVAIQKVVNLRKPFVYRHAEQSGAHLQADALLEVKTSQIPGGGNGVFALVDLVKKDIVTWYAGTRTNEPPEDRSYAIKLRRGYLNGAYQLTQGVGLGSFINRQQRELGCRKNCEFIECGGGKHAVYVAMTKSVKKGVELFTTYGRSYKMNYPNESYG